MSLFDVLNRYGLAALLKVLGALLLFVALYLVRLPLVLAVLGLEAGLRWVDRCATRQARHQPGHPIYATK